MFTAPKTKTKARKINALYHILEIMQQDGQWPLSEEYVLSQNGEKTRFYIELPLPTHVDFLESYKLQNWHITVDKEYFLETSQKAGAQYLQCVHITQQYYHQDTLEGLKVRVFFNRFFQIKSLQIQQKSSSLSDRWSTSFLTQTQETQCKKQALLGIQCIDFLLAERSLRHDDALQNAEKWSDELQKISRNHQEQGWDLQGYRKAALEFVDAIKEVNRYNELEIDTRDRPVLLTLARLDDIAARKKAEAILGAVKYGNRVLGYEQPIVEDTKLESSVEIEASKQPDSEPFVGTQSKKQLFKALHDAIEAHLAVVPVSSLKKFDLALSSGDLERIKTLFPQVKPYVKREMYNALIKSIVAKPTSIITKKIQICRYLHEESEQYRNSVVNMSLSLFTTELDAEPGTSVSLLFEAFRLNNLDAFCMLLEQGALPNAQAVKNNKNEAASLNLLSAIVHESPKRLDREANLYIQPLIDYGINLEQLSPISFRKNLALLKKPQAVIKAGGFLLKPKQPQLRSHPFIQAVQLKQFSLANLLLNNMDSSLEVLALGLAYTIFYTKYCPSFLVSAEKPNIFFCTKNKDAHSMNQEHRAKNLESLKAKKTFLKPSIYLSPLFSELPNECSGLFLKQFLKPEALGRKTLELIRDAFQKKVSHSGYQAIINASNELYTHACLLNDKNKMLFLCANEYLLLQSVEHLELWQRERSFENVKGLLKKLKESIPGSNELDSDFAKQLVACKILCDQSWNMMVANIGLQNVAVSQKESVLGSSDAIQQSKRMLEIEQQPKETALGMLIELINFVESNLETELDYKSGKDRKMRG